MKLAKLLSVGMLVSIVMFFSGCAGDDEGAPKDLGQAAYSISGIITQGTITGPGLAGVIVSLESEATATVTATTGADGTYTFSPVSNGTFTITASLEGHDVLPAGIGMFVSDASVTEMDFTAKPVMPPTNSPRYTDNNDGTVTDTSTGLIWQKQDDGTHRSWWDADTYCSNNSAGLAGTGWRLPTKWELLGIVDSSRRWPTIDPIFTNTKDESYWSSSTYAYNTGLVWGVDFFYGNVYIYSKVYYHYARCVRGGQ